MKLHIVMLLADELLKKHNLNDWYFKFDSAKRRFWCCNYSKKFISISHYLAKINTEEIVVDTILHEIAHALAGIDAKHWPKWKQIAKKIWCTWNRCYWEEVNQAKMKYTAKCNNCKKFNWWKFSRDFMIIFKEN